MSQTHHMAGFASSSIPPPNQKQKITRKIGMLTLKYPVCDSLEINSLKGKIVWPGIVTLNYDL